MASEEGAEELVAEGAVAEVSPGIDRRVIEADFVVNVRAGGAAADADVTNDVAAVNLLAGLGIEIREVAVPGGHAEAVIDNDHPAIPGAITRRENDSISRDVDGISVGGGNIHAGVKFTFTAERIEALAEASGQMSIHWPK